MRRVRTAFTSCLFIALLIGGGDPGCSSDSNQTPGDGGGDAASMNCGDPNQPIDPTALIDDMETPDFATPRVAGRNGSWWAGGDPSSAGASIQPNGDAAAEMIPGGRCGSQYAMHVTGQGFSIWAVLTVSMGWGAPDGGAEGVLPNDNHFHDGVTFWARIGDTSSNAVRFAISDKYSRPEGGYCIDGGAMDVACYDTFGVDLPQLDTTWKQYKIPFAGLTQRNFGLQRPELDSSSIYTIEFQFNPASVFDFWLDDISFY
jgi:hypothetical protein